MFTMGDEKGYTLRQRFHIINRTTSILILKRLSAHRELEKDGIWW